MHATRGTRHQEDVASRLQEGCDGCWGFHIVREDSLRKVMLIIASHTHWSLTELKAMTPDELSYWAEGLAEIQRDADSRRESSRGRR